MTDLDPPSRNYFYRLYKNYAYVFLHQESEKINELKNCVCFLSNLAPYLALYLNIRNPAECGA